MVCFDIVDAERFSTAPVIPHHLDYVNPPVGFQGVYVVPQMSFSETGKIETWEVFASSEGQVKLQVFHPLCDTQERYCAYNRSCISRFLSCLPANEESCDAGNEAFCVRTQTCQPFSTQHILTQKNRTITVSCSHQNNSMIGNTSMTNHSDCNATTWENYDQWQTSYHPGECQIRNKSGEPWQMGYYLVGENLVYLKEGYNIFEITTDDRIQVEIGDVIGFSTYQQKFPEYYPKAAYPLIGEVALKGDRTAKVYLLSQRLDRSMKTLQTEDAEYVLSGQLYLRARGSITSHARSTHSYTQSGMFSIQTEYDNAYQARPLARLST
ncbi:receptor for egg jelly 5 [Apostichopus japonicus]|uniref:Receptor for egg jelly 5 n=1 Tax=Stichopus japonicus TaxID=307972 RepID=A0A2G8KY39_STIJA|nr:receptor for egg jelly 5 [Apostichopus japonicus]